MPQSSVTDAEIEAALKRTGGNQTEAAAMLGMSPSYLRDRRYKKRLREAAGVKPPPAAAAPVEPLISGRANSYHEILEAAALHAKAREEASPSRPMGTVDLRKAKGPIGVFLISDLHLGAPQCDYLTFLRHVKFLKDIPNLYAIIQGDVLEYSISQRMLDSTLSQVMSPQEQARIWKQIVDDLVAKLLGAVIGNHELRAERLSGFDLGEFMYQALIKNKVGIYMKDGGMLRLNIGSQTYTWRITHGDSRFGSMYNKAHKASQLARMAFGWTDIASTGHTHEAAIYQDDQPAEDGNGTRTVTILQAGSYKVLGGEQYPDRLGFMSSKKARMPGVIFFPDEKRVLPFRCVEDMVPVLQGLSR